MDAIFLPFELKYLKVQHLFSPMNMGPIFLKFLKIKFTLALHSNLPWVYFSKNAGKLFEKFFNKIINGDFYSNL